MTIAEEITLEKRLARFIADRLAVSEPQQTPLFRLIAAHAAAREIIARAKTNESSLDHLDAKLRQLESQDYEI
jgi:hypothetical protein